MILSEGKEIFSKVFRNKENAYEIALDLIVKYINGNLDADFSISEYTLGDVEKLLESEKGDEEKCNEICMLLYMMGLGWSNHPVNYLIFLENFQEILAFKPQTLVKMTSGAFSI